MEQFNFRRPLIMAAEGKSISILAYTGGEMKLAGWDQPVVVDLAGMELPPQVPLLADHTRTVDSILGQGVATVVGGQLMVEGTIHPVGEVNQRIMGLNKGGFKFQASIGAEPIETQQVRPGATISVNEQTITAGKGGLILVTKSKLKEVSILGLGADDQTAVAIAAAANNIQGEATMDEKHAADCGCDECKAAVSIEAARVACPSCGSTRVIAMPMKAEDKPSGAVSASNLNEGVKTMDEKEHAENCECEDCKAAGVEAALKSKPGVCKFCGGPTGGNLPNQMCRDCWNGMKNMPIPPGTTLFRNDSTNGVKAMNKNIAAAATDPVAEMRAAAALESTRISAVRTVCGDKHPDIAGKAIAEGWTTDKVELEVLRAERAKAPAIHSNGSIAGFPVLEAAAVVQSRQFSEAELIKTYGEKTLEAVAKQYRGGLGLQEMLLEAALINGYTGRTFRDTRAILQAAFSTSEISGILSNVANKFLLQGFFSVESTWRKIAAIRNVTDFKTVTSYRLTGTEMYQQVGPDGEIKHGTLGEESFTNKANTYGLMLGITRTDIVNDDLGAITTVPRKLGRGSALKLNSVFWTIFKANTAFFYVNDQNHNYISGATTNLSTAGLKAAITKFRRQVDADGNLLALEPRIILAPPELEEPLLTLNASVTVNTGGSSSIAQQPNANIYGGRYTPAISAYLTDTLAWYLLADPNDVAAIEVAFLNGQESPTVETAQADFNVLGIQMRGYHDFGVALQDPRAGVMSKGQA